MKLIKQNRLPCSKLIPFEPSNSYKSLEYMIKKIIIEHNKLDLNQLIDCLKEFKENGKHDGFKISKSLFNKKKILNVLSLLCKEKKLVKKRKYFHDFKSNYQSIIQIVLRNRELKKSVSWKEIENKKEGKNIACFEFKSAKTKASCCRKQNKETEALGSISFHGHFRKKH